MASNLYSFKWTLRRMLPAALAICLIAMPTIGRATNNCAWMNEATASGLLGSEAVGTFTEAAGGQPAVCAFVSQSAGATHTLRITMELATDAHTRLGAV